MPVTLYKPLRMDGSDDPPFEYSKPVVTATDAIAAAGFYPQSAASNDMAAGISRDGSGNLVLKDANAGSHTLMSLLGSSFLVEGFLDITVAQGQDEVRGVITGLPNAPVHVLGCTAFERDNAVPSGLEWIFTPGILTADGFNWRLNVGGNEYWPETASVVVRVSYLWSNA